MTHTLESLGILKVTLRRWDRGWSALLQAPNRASLGNGDTAEDAIKDALAQWDTIKGG